MQDEVVSLLAPPREGMNGNLSGAKLHPFNIPARTLQSYPLEQLTCHGLPGREQRFEHRISRFATHANARGHHQESHIPHR